MVVGNNELHEANNLILNCQKAKSRLGWNSKINTETALKWTIERYTKYFDGENIREVTEKQIVEFQKL